ncbi:TIGR03086 family metal-binding protein [Amycolatopsis sp. NBC_01307]|uniref:TIGR03086 family metal-binding protein n=1 Tax=Amycolatopsis sp. NBC_01307 TaxID=2903561 RepID=UPI002E0DF5C8|nr:TIGR03086 family metal-binding protein [Amycolatopsis sp. NBC_01307]
MDLLEAHGQAIRAFGEAVHAAGDGAWGRRTPYTAWTVRDLVNHLVAEQLWAPSLLAGATLDDVGDRFDGDVLGEDPAGAWDAAAEGAREAFLDDGVLERTVHLSYGLVPAREYGWQMTIDAAVHSWDLARPAQPGHRAAGRAPDRRRAPMGGRVAGARPVRPARRGPPRRRLHHPARRSAGAPAEVSAPTHRCARTARQGHVKIHPIIAVHADFPLGVTVSCAQRSHPVTVPGRVTDPAVR